MKVSTEIRGTTYELIIVKEDEDDALWDKHVNGTDQWDFTTSCYTLEEVKRRFEVAGRNQICFWAINAKPYRWGLDPYVADGLASFWMVFSEPPEKTFDKIMKDLPDNPEEIRNPSEVLYDLTHSKKSRMEGKPKPEVHITLWCPTKPSSDQMGAIIEALKNNKPFRDTTWSHIRHSWTNAHAESDIAGCLDAHFELGWVRAILVEGRYEGMTAAVKTLLPDARIDLEVFRLPTAYWGADHLRLLEEAEQAFRKEDMERLKEILRVGALEAQAAKEKG